MTPRVRGYECNARMLSLKPREAARLQLSITIPADFPHDRIIHRKEMVWPDARVKDKKPENDRHTSTIVILGPKPSMQPSQCAGGEIRASECVCPPNALRKQTGPNEFACVLPPGAGTRRRGASAASVSGAPGHCDGMIIAFKAFLHP